QLARLRPTTADRMRQVPGVGDVKLRDFGPHVLPLIIEHCAAHPSPPAPPGPLFRQSAPPPPDGTRMSEGPRTPKQANYFELFRARLSLDEVAQRTGLTKGTLVKHLGEYIEVHQPNSIDVWVDDTTYQRVVGALRQIGPTDRLKPIYLALGEKVS